MNVQPLINELQERGVRLIPIEGNQLRIDAPRGVLSEDLRAKLSDLKPEILANRQRYHSIKARISSAMDYLATQPADKYDWGSESVEAVTACGELNEALYRYVANDNGSVEEVEAKFRAWIHSLEKKSNDGPSPVETMSLFI